MKNSTENKTKVISSEEVFKSKYFWIDKVTFERNGKIFKKDILSRNDSVIILPINDKDEIYLVSQFRDSFQKILLETVAGHIEEGESPLEAAKKELKEEAGLTADSWQQIAKVHTSANINDSTFVFLARDLKVGEQELEEDEDIELVKLPFSQTLGKIDSGEINIFSNISSLLILDKLRREGKA